ncbi:MAG TPA: hypothetical protein VK203_23660 [Nostocaceae cyanobacterium]|nr:hypothetical protein [Nostocaceae cyanobacterium]
MNNNLPSLTVLKMTIFAPDRLKTDVTIQGVKILLMTWQLRKEKIFVQTTRQKVKL